MRLSSIAQARQIALKAVADQASPMLMVALRSAVAPIFAALGLHLRLPAERLCAQQLAGMALLTGAAWGATTVTIRCSSLAAAPATETLFYQLLGESHKTPFVAGSAMVLLGIGLVSGRARPRRGCRR